MKRIILVAMFFLIFTSFMYVDAQWAKTYGGSYNDLGYSIQQTSDGGYIVVGETSSFGAGYNDVWVLKLSSTGTIEWQRAYGGIGDDYAWEIQQTSDGGYIVAGYTSSFGAGEYDVWVFKLSLTGAIEWQRTYGGIDHDWGQTIRQTNDGGYIVVAYTRSFGAGYYDFWILKLSSTGEIEWQRTYGGSSSDYAWEIQQTSDGGYIVVGETYSFGAGEDDVWVFKLSSIGAIEWQRTYGGIDRDWGQTIRQTSDGGYILSCGTRSFGAGDWDFWILKLSSTGEIEWQRTYGGIDSDWAGASVPISDGGYIVTGLTSSFGAGEYDVWVFKLSSIGAIEWQRTYGGSSHDLGYSTQQTSDGGYIAAGYTRSFGAGEYDAWVIKLYSDGDIDSSCGFIGSSNASVLSTYVYPEGTYISPGNTYVTPLTTSVSPQDTYASVMLLCEAPIYTLTISTTIGGTIDPALGSYTYYSRTEVQIEAIPDTGYRFSEWKGDVPEGHETDNPITITMDSDKSIIANFIRQQYTLTITAGTGGTTDPSPGTYTYDSGAEVSIKAIPNSGYEFSGWSGDASGTDNPIIITMGADKSITANFSVVTPDEPEPKPKEKDGCFIATAAYGSSLHPHIDVLREFRDERLMTNKFGRGLVKIYYRYSPPIAGLIARNKALKITVRVALLPLVGLSFLTVH